MTSVLYSAGLNYQAGNPVRQEINAVRRELDAVRKQVEVLTEENLIYRKFIMRALQPPADPPVDGTPEFLNDLTALSNSVEAKVPRQAGGRTVQGAGFQR